MDPSEGNHQWEAADKSEFPPLYDSVNGKECEDPSKFCSTINRALLPMKLFYFFFYGAVGSLFPFIALYFKHLWLSPTQAGILVGLRPLVQSVSLPFWAILADKCRLKKLVLLVGVCGWLLTHTSILLIPAGEKPLSCYSNITDKGTPIRRSIDDMSDYRKKHVDEIERENDMMSWVFREGVEQQSIPVENTDPFQKQLQGSVSKKSFQATPFLATQPDSNSSGPSSETVKRETVNANVNTGLEKSIWNYSNRNVPVENWHTFACIAVVIMIGNLFAAPAQTMANTATLQTLGSENYKYGAQRYCGSLGWGITSFVVGMLVSLNHDSEVACKGLDDINYTPCFYAFGILMLLALVAALFFRYEDKKDDSAAQIAVCRSVCQELDPLTCLVLSTALIAGFNMGFIQIFLFWYLQTIGGTQTLFSVIVGLNAIGETAGFAISGKLIEKFGHLKVLSLGLAAYVIRFFVYSIVEDARIVLCVELLKAFTASAVWSSIVSFIGVRNGYETTLQCLIHFLYWGIGYGGGGIIGGVFTEYVGAKIMFLALAVVSALDMIVILVVLASKCCPNRTQHIYMSVVSDEEEEENDSETEQ